MKTYIWLVAIVQCCLSAGGEYLDVELAQGTVRGYRHPTRDLYEFHGIPYATAPTGREKFKGPLPAPSWDGVFNATNNLIICPQYSLIIGNLPYTEDCLVVNVFAPDTDSTSRHVLVIIHGGGFSYGYGNSGIPYNLADRDIIVVTFNYRVGVHGFLCLNTENAPGNAGLKDQIHALQWVKNNIEAFGGNPQNITISGYSAGAAAAELLMLSPAATDLFSKVILESGSAMNTWAVNPKSLEYARNIAIQNGATNVENIEQLEEYYTSLSYTELIALIENGLVFGFLPCIENANRNDSVITTLPEDILRSGDYIKLPLLTGYTDAEGLLYYDQREILMREMNENFSSQLPPNFDSYSILKEQEAIDLIKSFYFDEEAITENSLRNFTDYFTDSLFSYGIVESSKLHALNGAQIYLYEFSYVLSTDELRETGLGANHCAQTALIFINVVTQPDGPHTATDATVQSRLLDMWTNFIKTGEPSLSDQPSIWEPLEPEEINYLVIDEELEKKTFPIPERLRLWETIMQEDGDTDSGEYLEVKITQGVVRGYKHPMRAFYEFHGIPYATVPTGRDKFKAPLPPPNWEEVFNATNDLILCPQNFGGVPYTEDCLIVNVFVPNNTQLETDPLKPVLVIIHGGGFSVGYGNMGLPYNIVERDIIVVTLNYRVFVQGFLCLHTENVPGNAGLKDQLAALKWVKENVRAFGGNPNNVTLLGYSAGSFSAEALMLSPAANGLFHRVILESGSAHNTWLNLKGPEFAKIVAAANGASDVEDITKLEDFYLSLSHTELLALEDVPGIFGSFLPCLESERDDSIITKSLHEVLKSGDYTALPLITGYTDGEGLIFYEDRDRIMSEMNENFSTHLPPNFPLYVAIDEAKAIEMLKLFYFNGDEITENLVKNYTDYFSDGAFIHGIVESARLHALNSSQVYLYEVTYEASIYQTIGPSGLGSTHCTQTFLILNEGPLSPFGVLNENDLIVQRRLVDMWSNFIKYGEPIPQGGDDYWEPLSPEKMNYLVIDLNNRQDNFPIPERLELWDEIMKENNEPDSAAGVAFSFTLFLLTLCLIFQL